MFNAEFNELYDVSRVLDGGTSDIGQEAATYAPFNGTVVNATDFNAVSFLIYKSGTQAADTENFRFVLEQTDAASGGDFEDLPIDHYFIKSGTSGVSSGALPARSAFEKIKLDTATGSFTIPASYDVELMAFLTVKTMDLEPGYRFIRPSVGVVLSASGTAATTSVVYAFGQRKVLSSLDTVRLL